ncbi:NAD(P)/FAD-dependent oxidoreductase [Azospirillum melinis]|uniref:NAD(P)/FAD-dependent oxidoreductase n=1 Tax=Azospirillum melinis TaxID=328839 RepID=UPI003756D642
MAQVAILGAGMVGICTALALQERGHDCVVVDRRPPGSETSYGNAGIIQAEAVEPYALPANPLAMLRMALGWKNAVALHWPSLPRQLPALYSYWRSSSGTPLSKAIPLWHRLILEAVPRHDALIKAAGAGDLIRTRGYWEVHATGAGLAAALLDAERRKRRYGIDFEAADSGMLARAEPTLRAELPGAIHWTEPWTCVAPGELVTAYADLFRTRGGRIVQADAAPLAQSGRGWRVAGETVEHAVVALGPWSPTLLKGLGYRVPMVRKRGYHLHYGCDDGPSRPMLLADHSVVLSPMRAGLRIATAAELSAGSPPAAYPGQLARGEAAARSLFRFGKAVEDSAWSGTRPCLPGMLPLVCKAPRHAGLWFHFGHGHQGFTLGPVTAERLARVFDGDMGAVEGLDCGLS